MRAWFQKTLSSQTPALTGVLHSIRRLREQHAWFPLTKHKRVEERSLRVAAKQRELPLPLDLHTDRGPVPSSIEEMHAYYKLPGSRLLLYVFIAVFVMAWIWIFSLQPPPSTGRSLPSKDFQLAFGAAFLDEPLARELAYQTLFQLGYDINQWNSLEAVRKARVTLPDGSVDVYLERGTKNAGLMIFTNATEKRSLIMSIHLRSNIVSCVVQEEPHLRSSH